MGEQPSARFAEVLERLAEHVDQYDRYPTWRKPGSGLKLDIHDKASLIEHIKSTIDDAETKSFIANEAGNKFYFHNEATNTFLVIDPDAPGGGTVYRPRNLQQGIGQYQKAFNSSREILGHLPKEFHGNVGKVNKILDAIGDAGKFSLKVLKILGPIGIAGAILEANELSAKAQSAIDGGALSPDALIEYDALLALHVAQATADPSMLGGEAVVQLAYEEWAAKWDVPDDVKNSLEPSSLIEMITGDIKLEDQAAATPQNGSIRKAAFATDVHGLKAGEPTVDHDFNMTIGGTPMSRIFDASSNPALGNIQIHADIVAPDLGAQAWEADRTASVLMQSHYGR